MKSCMDIVLLAIMFPDKKNLNTIIGHNGGYKFIVEYILFQFNSVLFKFSNMLDYLKYN